MKILRHFLSFSDASGAKETPLIARAAHNIHERLRALGLYVKTSTYGNEFYEIFASSSPHMIVLPDSAEASGIAVLLAAAYEPPTIVFERINSISPGLGRRMVAAVLEGLRDSPGLFRRLRVNDLSPLQADGRRWWEHVAGEHGDFEWVVTHDPDGSHRETFPQ
jgi:hypothetical protein